MYHERATGAGGHTRWEHAVSRRPGWLTALLMESGARMPALDLSPASVYALRGKDGNASDAELAYFSRMHPLRAHV